MSVPEMQFKKAVVALLDKEGREHREKHQANKANRYTISAVGGYSLEVMFEKGPKGPRTFGAPSKSRHLSPTCPGNHTLPKHCGRRRTSRASRNTAATAPCKT